MIKVKSEELKKAIFTQGFSLSGFARECGKSKSSINNVLKRKTISAEFANKICKTLNTAFENFFLVT